jgi:hypothetical protein
MLVLKAMREIAPVISGMFTASPGRKPGVHGVSTK